MFKELICAVALSGTIGMTAPQNSSTDTFYQDVNITETYEYQTNEVNSVDDLIVGNIYMFTIDELPNETFSFGYSNYIRVNNNFEYKVKNENARFISSIDINRQAFLSLNSTDNWNTVCNISLTEITFPLKYYFIYQTWSNVSTKINYISASDYLGEHTVTVTPKEYNGLFAIFDNFLHERLFSGGILDTTNVTVFNATLSLGQWLSTTTSIVLLCLIVLLLVLLIKFIFKYVGGMMIWRS